MKKKLFFSLAVCILILSCEKSDESKNKITSPFTVMYEIQATSLLFSSWGSTVIKYTNGTGQTDTQSMDYVYAWSETVNINTEIRPLNLVLHLSPNNSENLYFMLYEAGSLTSNIYINGSLVATSICQSSINSNGTGYKISIEDIVFVVN